MYPYYLGLIPYDLDFTTTSFFGKGETMNLYFNFINLVLTKKNDSLKIFFSKIQVINLIYLL